VVAVSLDWQSTFYLILWLMHHSSASQKSHGADELIQR